MAIATTPLPTLMTLRGRLLLLPCDRGFVRGIYIYLYIYIYIYTHIHVQRSFSRFKNIIPNYMIRHSFIIDQIVFISMINIQYEASSNFILFTIGLWGGGCVTIKYL